MNISCEQGCVSIAHSNRESACAAAVSLLPLANTVEYIDHGQVK